MSLPHVILTVLSQREATGYDITKGFSCSIGNFWKASHQQVYRELNKLAEISAVQCRLEPQDGKPDRKVYSITQIGKETLYEWYLSSPKHPTDRDEISAKMLACNVFNQDPMITHIRLLIEEAHLQLHQYRNQEKAQTERASNFRLEDKLEHLTLRRNIILKEAWVVWAEEVLKELNSLKNEASAEISCKREIERAETAIA